MATNLLKLCRLCTSKTVITRSSRCFSSTKPLTTDKDKQIHTGQEWEANDYRMVRFVDQTKHVNEQYAIDLIAEEAPIQSSKRVVSCDGGGGPLGHPKVYINLDQPGNHTCGYCGLRFFKDGSH